MLMYVSRLDKPTRLLLDILESVTYDVINNRNDVYVLEHRITDIKKKEENF